MNRFIKQLTGIASVTMGQALIVAAMIFDMTDINSKRSQFLSLLAVSWLFVVLGAIALPKDE